MDTNTNIIDLKFQGLNTNERDIPTDGGCSVLVIDITNIVIPTDIAPIIIYRVFRLSNGILSTSIMDKLLKIIPDIIPIVYPPSIFLDLAEYAEGIVKIIKVVAPKLAMMVVYTNRFNNIRINIIDIVANKHCNIYLFKLFLSFGSQILIITTPYYVS